VVGGRLTPSHYFLLIRRDLMEFHRLSARDTAEQELDEEAYRREVDEIKKEITERRKLGYIKTFILSFRKAFREARKG
jgi:hypothetical protein